MKSVRSIAVVIPCYKVARHIGQVVASIPAYIDFIIVVDDCCPVQSVKQLMSCSQDPRLVPVYNQTNLGVGGATMSGFRKAIELGVSIVVKMDGDGQMDPQYLPRLLQPILSGHADFTKGNRFYDLVALKQMPLIRRFGNMGLSFLTKAASGYWGMSDPTNGYFAVHVSALKMLTFENLALRYFFESSLLIQLNIIRSVVVDVPIPAKYGDEVSNLSVTRSLFGFPARLLCGMLRRIVWKYFIYDVTAVSFMLFFGASFFLFGMFFGVYRWVWGEFHGQVQSAGTVALAFVPTLIGFMMLLQAMLLDVMAKPDMPIHKIINDQQPE